MFVLLCLQLTNRTADCSEFCPQNEVQEFSLDKTVCVVCSGTRLLVSVLWLEREANLRLRQTNLEGL